MKPELQIPLKKNVVKKELRRYGQLVRDTDSISTLKIYERAIQVLGQWIVAYETGLGEWSDDGYGNVPKDVGESHDHRLCSGPRECTPDEFARGDFKNGITYCPHSGEYTFRIVSDTAELEYAMAGGKYEGERRCA